MVWTNDLGYRESLALDGKKHSEIIHWIRKTSLKAKQNRVYEYKLHFDLPYESISSDFVFQKPSKEEILGLIQKRNLVQQALEKVLDKNIAIRIWPHHFDTGGYATRSVEPDFGVGWGMAIPDRVADSMYFYISYYKDGKSYLPDDLPALSLGDWHRDGFTGAVLPFRDSDEDGFAFFKQVHDRIMSH